MSYTFHIWRIQHLRGQEEKNARFFNSFIQNFDPHILRVDEYTKNLRLLGNNFNEWRETVTINSDSLLLIKLINSINKIISNFIFG